MTLRSLDILGKYSLYSIPRDDGGDDGGIGGWGDAGDDGFGNFGTTGDAWSGEAWGDIGTLGGSGDAAADAGVAAGAAAADAFSGAAWGDVGTLGGAASAQGFDEGGFASAFGSASAGGFDEGGFATAFGSSSAGGFDEGGFAAAYGDAAAAAVAGAIADGVTAGSFDEAGFAAAYGDAAADAASSAIAGASYADAFNGAAWGSYEAGTTAAAIANALAAQGKNEAYINAAIQSPSFATGFSQGLASAVANQAAQAAQMAAQGIFGIVGPNSPVATPAQLDQYNAIVDQVTRDVTAQKTAQYNSLFGIDLNSPMTVSFKDWDALNPINPLDPNVNPNPVSVADPANVAAVSAGILGDQTYTGFDPSGLFSPASPAVSPGISEDFDQGWESLFDPAAAPDVPALPGPTQHASLDPSNIAITGPNVSMTADPNTLQSWELGLVDHSPQAQINAAFQEIDDFLSGRPDLDPVVDLTNQDLFDPAFYETPAIAPQQFANLTTPATQALNPQDVYDIINTPIDPSQLMDDPIGFMNPAAMVNRDITVSPLEDISPVDPGRFGINQPTTPDIAQHAMVTALTQQSPAMFDPYTAFSPIDPDRFAGIQTNPMNPVDTFDSRFGFPNTPAPEPTTPAHAFLDQSHEVLGPQNPFSGPPGWLAAFDPNNVPGPVDPGPFVGPMDPGPFVGPMDPGPAPSVTTSSPTSVTVGGTFSGDPSGAPVGDPGAGNIDPGLLWWMLQQQQGAGSPAG